jgi:Uma2 family endonuclease
MEEYIANGTQTGWLIDPIEKKVHIYRPGVEVEVIENPSTISGEGSIAGFTLNLDGIID